MSMTTYLVDELPSSVSYNKTEKFKDLTTFDELTQELLKTQKELLKNPNDKESLAKINQIIEERTREEERIKSLYNPELVKKFTSEQLKKYAIELNQFQNIRIARQETQKRQQEKIAAIQESIKEFAKNMHEKAEQFVNFVNKNPSAKQNGVELKIEDGKVVLYKKGRKKRFFTIPQMDTNGNIKHQENLAILNDLNNGMNSFVKKYFPEVKTYAEIGQENIKKEKIANIQKKVKKYNENLKNITEKSIKWLEEKFDLPKGTDLLLDGNRVVLNLPDGKQHYFTLNIKDVSGKETHSENNGRNIYGNLKKWVEKYTGNLKAKES